jgi:hypothetical protein
MHVAHRVNVNQGSHESDHGDHGGGELVDIESDGDPEIARRDPLIHRPVEMLPRKNLPQGNQREEARQHHRTDGDMRGFTLQPLAEKTVDHKGQQRQQGNQDMNEGWALLHFLSSIF